MSRTRPVMRGSSPRVWGIPSVKNAPAPMPRFIPTRVGNTTYGLADSARPSVHPHACGEYCDVVNTCPPAIGSSPRVWGIHHRTNGTLTIFRFIPTRVGNTHRGHPINSGSPVHPHACGEYEHGVLINHAGGGSSPRVWGIRPHSTFLFPHVRFIPTRVGNTRLLWAWCRAISVHPHACGEYRWTQFA